MKFDSLEALYIDQLKDAHSAERQLVEALPKMIDAADSEELRDAITAHLKETEGHVKRIEKIFKRLDEKPSGERCEAMKGLIKEANQLVKSATDPKVRDAAIICAAQKVEHYEIATYGCLRAYARILNDTEAIDLIEQTLEEEGAADKKLTEIAEQSLNQVAARA